MIRTETTQKLSVPGMRLAGLRHLPLTSKIALGLLVVVALMAVFAPLIAPFNPLATGLTRGPAAPDAVHWFGTDRQGRDVFSRLVHGAGFAGDWTRRDCGGAIGRFGAGGHYGDGA